MQTQNKHQPQCSQKKLNIKFQSQNKTKRIRDVPENFSALKKTVEALLGNDKKNEQQPSQPTGTIVIKYVDKDQEMINVSDDEDLLTAYEVAEMELEGNLKFVIETQQMVPQVQEKKTCKKEKKGAEKTEKKDKKMCKKKKAKKAAEEEKKQIETATKEMTLESSDDLAHQNLPVSKKVEDEEDVDMDSEEEAPKGKFNRHRKGRGLPPRKAIKKLIYQELETQAPSIFEQLMKCKEIGQPYQPSSNQEQINTSQIVTHAKVECDGCGISPITGIRYKCCVCKNFDYCEICEERLGHEHPFIKLVKPDLEPTTILTGVYDNNTGVDVNTEDPKQCFKQFKDIFKTQYGDPKDWSKNPELQKVASDFLNMAENYVNAVGVKDPQGTQEENKEESKGEPNIFEQNPHFKFMANNFLQRARNYVSKLGEEGAQQNCKEGWNFCSNRGGWGQKRAVIVRKPEDVIVCEPGTMIFADIAVQNQTKWPWKRGCFVGLVNKDAANSEKCPLVWRDFAIDQEVRGMQTVELNIPIEIPSDLPNSKESPIYEIPLAFYGPRNGAFGQQFTIKVQVKEGENELNLFRAAITLAEAGMGTFDQCVEALRKCNLDENAALQMLVEMNEDEKLYK